MPVVVYRGHFRTSTYLEDTCRTLCNIIKNFKAGEVYNVGGLEYHSIEDLADIIWEITGADRSLIEYRDAEILTTKSKQVDIGKAQRDLDHKLTISLKDGVQKTIDWMRDYYKIK
jgi:dTDP-glucose 4,6-dehydratase